MNFRNLEPNETRILFMRHGNHKANVLTPETVAMCRATGEALKATGLEIDMVVSSPAGRAVETALETLHGYGTMVYVRTNDLLADTDISPESAEAVKKAQIQAAGLISNGEEALAEVLLDPKGEFAELMSGRGAEGNTCLVEIAADNPGKTVLAPSHGIARIENTIQALRDEELHKPRLVKNCQIVELILDSSTSSLIEENWLDIAV